MSESLLDSAPDPEPVVTGPPSDMKSQAFRGAALLSFRQVLVGVVTVVGIVALPLLLGPAEFAMYGYVNTAMLVGAALGDLGLGAYIIKNRVSDRDLSGSLALQLAFWLPISILLLLLATTVNPFGFSMLSASLLVLCVMLFSLQALPTALLEKNLRFRTISVIEVTQRVILVTGAVLLAVFQPAQWTIPLAAAAAALVGYPLILRATRWRWRPKFAKGEPLFRGFSSEWWQVRIANQAAYAAYPLLGGLLFSAHDVGLIIWDLAITSIPAYLAPMVSRAIFPTLSKATPEDRITIYSNLFRGLLLLGVPMVAALFVAADPFTEYIFGSEWTDGIPLLRLESLTTVIGIASMSLVPLLFISCRPAFIKWTCVGMAVSVVVLSLALSPLLSFLSISVATLISSSVLLVIFDRGLRREISYSPLKDMLPALTGLAAGIACGLPVVMALDSVAGALLGAAVAAGVQLGVTILLKGGVDIRGAVARLRAGAAAA